MNCKGYYAILRDYMEGEVSAAQRTELEQHVSECKACSAFHKLAYEISCRELTEFLDDYVDGRLSPERRAVFDRHLEICTECKDYVAGYKTTIELGKSAYSDPDEPAEPTFMIAPESLVRAILAARKKK
jgi:anti-sigma factor RsiW